MRAIILPCLAAVLVTIAGICLLRVIGAPIELRPAMCALGAALVASILAGTPLAMLRDHSAVASAQAGLLGTVLHLMVLVIAAGIGLMGHLPLGRTFIDWLAILYVATLVALIAAISSAFRRTAAARHQS